MNIQLFFDKIKIYKLPIILLFCELIIGCTIYFYWTRVSRHGEKLEIFQENPVDYETRLYFDMQPSSAPGEFVLRLMLDAGNYPIAFTQAKVTFDPSKIKLSNEITTTDRLKTVNIKSTKDDANSSGQIYLSIALASGDSANPPAGVMELAKIPMKTITSASNDPVDITFDNNGIELVTIVSGDSARDLTFSTENMELILNPAPTVSVVPTISIIPSPINTPIVTIVPTDQPTCTMKSSGDANCDGSINGIDYSIWLNSQCHPGPGQTCARYDADFNGDGNVDDADYFIWLNNRYK